MDSKLYNITDELITKYNKSSSYYTSYPTLQKWSKVSSSDVYTKSLINSYAGKNFPFSIYIHFPFCPKLCYYCCCNKIISQDKEKITEFLKYLFLEIDLFISFLKENSIKHQIQGIHLGGALLLI